MIAEPDKVVGHFKCSGTNEGEWQGKPPTGRRFEDIDEIYIFKVEESRIAGALAAVEDNAEAHAAARHALTCGSYRW